MIHLDKQRALSLIVAVGYIVFFNVAPDSREIFAPYMFPILGMGLIWFGDDLGELTGFYAHHHKVDQKSPGCLVQLVGWIFLFFPVLKILLGLTGRGD